MKHRQRFPLILVCAMVWPASALPAPFRPERRCTTSTASKTAALSHSRAASSHSAARERASKVEAPAAQAAILKPTGAVAIFYPRRGRHEKMDWNILGDCGRSRWGFLRPRLCRAEGPRRMKHSDRFYLGRSRLNRVLMAAILALALACPSGARPVHETVGWRPTMIPLLNFSSDDGTGYGLRANLFEYDGHSVPYRRQYSAKYLSQPRASGYTACSSIRPNSGPAKGLRSNWSMRRRILPITTAASATRKIAGYSQDQRTFRQAFPEFKVKWIRTLRFPWRLAHRRAFEPQRY